MIHPRASALAVLLAASALTSCGNQGTPEEEVVKSLRTYTALLVDGNGEACDRMSRAGQHELTAFAARYQKIHAGPDCPSDVRDFSLTLNGVVQQKLRDADVGEVRVDGDRAEARIANVDARPVLLRREGGEWRVERAWSEGWHSFGIATYPPVQRIR